MLRQWGRRPLNLKFKSHVLILFVKPMKFHYALELFVNIDKIIRDYGFWQNLDITSELPTYIGSILRQYKLKQSQNEFLINKIISEPIYTF